MSVLAQATKNQQHHQDHKLRMVSLSPDDTKIGYLTPWEVAKAFAYHEVVRDVAEHLGEQPSQLLGGRVDVWIAGRLTLKGGGKPSARAVRNQIHLCSDSSWYPGKPLSVSTGRPSVVTEHQKDEIARVAMELKRGCKRNPTPAQVRSKLPKLSLNPATQDPLSDKSIRDVFRTRCFDEDEDDPWQWLASPSQDCLPEEMKPLRVACAEHYLETFTAGAWVNDVAIDPCSSLLPRTAARLHEQQVSAMGKMKWMSKNAQRKGVNLRAPATAKSQTGRDVLQVHWTPVFARGKIHIHVCVRSECEGNPALPTKLNDSVNLAKFVRNVLPKILEDMKEEHGWRTLPRVLVHDKASYMVTSFTNTLNAVFAGACVEAGMRSWLGDSAANTEWLTAKWGDVYLHETAISHIRRLLNTRFACSRLNETAAQFRVRMGKVSKYMNSPEFSAPGGGGLDSLAKDMRWRCSEVVRLQGERLPK